MKACSPPCSRFPSRMFSFDESKVQRRGTQISRKQKPYTLLDLSFSMCDMANAQIDRQLLEAALVGLQHQRDRIDAKITEVRGILDGTACSRSATQSAAPGPKRRTMSPAARRRIAAAQRKRWAAFHKAQDQARSARVGATEVAAKRAAKPVAGKKAIGRKRRKPIAQKPKRAVRKTAVGTAVPATSAAPAARTAGTEA